MGCICKSCGKNNNNILLIGLKKNNKLFELNSFLQCICHIQPIVNKIKCNYNNIKDQKEFKECMRNGKCLTASFRVLIDKIFQDSSKMRIESSEDILKMIYKIFPQYNENQQLLMNFFLMRLHFELNKAININQNNNLQMSDSDKIIAFKKYLKNFQEQNKSIISDYFFGTYYTSITCAFCKYNEFIFFTYIFGYYSINQVYLYKIITWKNGKNTLYSNKIINPYEINIYDCLNYDQQIKTSFQVCKKCGYTIIHYHQNFIFVTSTILSFIFNKNDYMPNNINFLIEENINVNNFVEDKQIKNYELIGIIYYFYPNRYIAYSKNTTDKKWYCYEDESTSVKNNFQEVIANNYIPYMLFYKQL